MTQKYKNLKVGLSPGTVVYTGEMPKEPVRISIFNPDTKNFDTIDQEKVLSKLPKYESTWVNINGLHDTELVKKLGEHFGIHYLILEDIVNPHQRPKIEEYPECVYIVIKMLTLDEESDRVDTEQISILLGKDFVLTFHEKPGDIFKAVHKRLRSGKIINKGMTYLTYALIDCVIDNYFVLLEKRQEDLEELEDRLIANPQVEDMHTIHNLKRETTSLRKSIWPLREIVRKLQQESDIIDANVNIYFRDVYDHIAQIMDHVETFREMLSSMHDIYLTSVSNKMNEIMKVLTFIATIFIPLSFVVGLYGMNFDHMPELKWKWGYPAVWGVMISIVGIMLYHFKSRKWI